MAEGSPRYGDVPEDKQPVIGGEGVGAPIGPINPPKPPTPEKQ